MLSFVSSVPLWPATMPSSMAAVPVDIWPTIAVVLKTEGNLIPWNEELPGKCYMSIYDIAKEWLEIAYEDYDTARMFNSQK